MAVRIVHEWIWAFLTIPCSRRIFRSRTAVGALGALEDGAVQVQWCSCRWRQTRDDKRRLMSICLGSKKLSRHSMAFAGLKCQQHVSLRAAYWSEALVGWHWIQIAISTSRLEATPSSTLAMGWKYTPAFPDTLSHYEHLSTKIDGRHFFMLTLQLLVGIDEVEPSRIQVDVPFLQT